ncbi:MAG: acyl-ACP thioesterase [Deltaproteobacteria bacterium]|nr:acyl-ACP thioesterase [Deltaproteobacteria bacterium]
MTPIVTHRSMANIWNCDEMGHMNVRQYIGKADSATAHMANELGLGPRTLAQDGLLLCTQGHHVRFIREVHAGTGLCIRTLVVEVAETAIRLCHEIRGGGDDSLRATVTAICVLMDANRGSLVPFPEETRKRAERLLQPLPLHAAPRGLAMTPSKHEPTLARATQLGMTEMFRGTVEPSQCDGNGYMLPSNVIASISDGIPNFFLELPSDPNGLKFGGAALEYRLTYHRPCPVGSLVVIMSAMAGVAEKILHHVHWMLDAETGEAIASAHAVSVFFDLVERRAITMPETERRHYRSMVIPELSLT